MAANRTKTIEWMCPNMIADYASGSSYNNSGDFTIYIPETTDRAFVSVYLEICVVDKHASPGQDMTAFAGQFSCDSGSNYTSQTVTTTVADSGENWSHMFFLDVTAEFSARFGSSGSNATCRWGWYVNGTSMTYTNAMAKLYITYNYDDSAHATRIKTVRIPIESLNERLSSTMQEIKQGSATNQLPDIIPNAGVSAFLPENTPVIRQMFLELWTNYQPSTTGDAALSLQIGSGGTPYTFGVLEGGSSSPVGLRFLWDLTGNGDYTTGAAKALYAEHSLASGNYYNNLGGWMTVNYEYNHADSTTILNSIVFALGGDTYNLGASTEGFETSVTKYISEPATITLKQSGVFCRLNISATSTTFVYKVGSQSTTTYTTRAQTGQAGQSYVMHRVDSGGNGGAAFTLSGGKVTITSVAYAGTASRISMVGYFMILNYTSGKHTSGDGAHTHSVFWGLFGNNRATATALTVTPTPPTIIESNYYMCGVSPYVYSEGTGTTTVYLLLQAQHVVMQKWVNIITVMLAVGIGEKLFQTTFGVGDSWFKRYPNDPDTTRMNIETSRSWRLIGTTALFGLGLWITYHSMTCTVSGTVSGSAGGTVYLSLLDYTTKELLDSTSRSDNGAYTFTWYDTYDDVVVVGYEDATHAGISAKGDGS